MKSAKTKSSRKKSLKKTAGRSGGTKSSSSPVGATPFGATPVGATLIKNVLFRPDRFQYVRGQSKKSDGCVFCRAAKNEPTFETLCVFKSEHTLILLNKFPYNSGHVLIVPRQHKGHLLKLGSVEFQDLHETLKIAVEALETVYQPAGLNIGVNHGKAAGAGIPDHLHYHVVPRWESDLNFFPLIAETKAVVETLEQTYNKLMTFFETKKK